MFGSNIVNQAYCDFVSTREVPVKLARVIAVDTLPQPKVSTLKFPHDVLEGLISGRLSKVISIQEKFRHDLVVGVFQPAESSVVN